MRGRRFDEVPACPLGVTLKSSSSFKAHYRKVLGLFLFLWAMAVSCASSFGHAVFLAMFDDGLKKISVLGLQNPEG